MRIVALLLVALLIAVPAPISQTDAARSYLGFDRNIYPGDASLPILRKTFTFSSYWLSPPPGENISTWRGKRQLLRSQGFGFVLLYRARGSRELRNETAARGRGVQDAKDAAAKAKAEGFSSAAVIFLDIEEGGRLPPAYHAYLRAWFGELTRRGYRPGVYCSGIPVEEEPGVSITTADDIRSHPGSGGVAMWVYNDACPPSPGCTFPENPPIPHASGISSALIWQFAQSPRRKEFTARCPANYHKDGNCYAPDDTAHKWFLDVNTATSPDPSGVSK